jgi:glutaredoxin
MKLSRTLLIICSLSLTALFLLVMPAHSKKLYTWKDKNGKIHRTYYRPPAEYTQEGQASNQSSQQTTQQNKVELYVTSWCPYCKKARQFFKSRGIKYKAYDIEKDAKAAARQRKLDSRKGVPFAVINGIKIHGYSPENYASALK